MRATVLELARRIKPRSNDAEVLALCNMILRQRVRNNAQVREWRKANPPRANRYRSGRNRKAFLASQRVYMRKYYRRRKRQGQG
jgi:hypothetical protein